jgi:pyruvate dehydrogenase E2 component (dihydrolipoyllysine-residue acetyltransferase)
LVEAWASALEAVPAANAVWAGDEILVFSQVDVSVAVALENGLVTPVIRAANTKSASEIAREIKDFALRARARKLKQDELRGGVSTVSNLGMQGIRQFAAIINPPQSTILAVGASQRRPVEGPNGGVLFAAMMTVTLACDHRVIDGVLGAILLAAFRERVEGSI